MRSGATRSHPPVGSRRRLGMRSVPPSWSADAAGCELRDDLVASIRYCAMWPFAVCGKRARYDAASSRPRARARSAARVPAARRRPPRSGGSRSARRSGRL